VRAPVREAGEIPAPLIIEVADPAAGFPATGRHEEYEDFLTKGDPEAPWVMPEDEWESISLNYTSGTTGRPKGVVYHHRGAYLMTMGTVISWRMALYPKYLAIVPLFHCNGWNHSWMMPLLGGTLHCCRNVSAAFIFSTIAAEGITHFGGAPIVLNMLTNATAAERRSFDHQVEVFTAAAPPPAATLQAIEKMNFNVTQVYGLTETYGHVTECIWDDERWGHLNDEERAAIKARTGVAFPMMEEIDVFEPGTRTPVARDGASPGEIMFRGNAVMKGYYRNPEAGEEAFVTGYLASGDIAVQYPDGYIKITDRAKDIIISGGENVSSVEIEGVLMAHPDVLLCAVVAKPDDRWGEVPFAFVEPTPNATPDSTALMNHCRERLAGFKTPKGISFLELPKTSTGKIQKFKLRELARTL
ncbi:MAG: AMP-binding protein, partial [Rhodobacteraceae bacterium]|nr:AMP-binding protein [Paracoccaceae bacterium]